MIALGRIVSLVFFLLIFNFPAAALGQTPASPVAGSLAEIAAQRLQGEIIRAAKSAGGTVGVSAVHIESGRRLGLNSAQRFPMASTYKIPIALQIFWRVDRGEISLDQMVAIKPTDLHPGSGILTKHLHKPGVALSVRNLLELMLVISDNSSTDLLLHLAGGPEAVTARVKELGIGGMEINRSTIRLIADASGYALPGETAWTPEVLEKMDEAVTPESRKAAVQKFEGDLRDTSTPEAMRALLERIYQGQGLKPESRAVLLDIMERCQVGKARIKGILPAETVVAHKTGTIGRTTNDVGIIKLPDGAGHVALAVFLKSSEKEIPERERAISHIARSVYDFFLFQPSGP